MNLTIQKSRSYFYSFLKEHFNEHVYHSNYDFDSMSLEDLKDFFHGPGLVAIASLSLIVIVVPLQLLLPIPLPATAMTAPTTAIALICHVMPVHHVYGINVVSAMIPAQLNG